MFSRKIQNFLDSHVLPINLIAKAKEHDNAEAAKDDAREARAKDVQDSGLSPYPTKGGGPLETYFSSNCLNKTRVG
jgi:hypothetical protein